MIKVITTVGTSLFTNFVGQSHCGFQDNYENLKNSLYKDWSFQEERINSIKKDRCFRKWILKNLNASCAEISSLLKIAETEKNKLHVCLISTETILSRLAAEIIRDMLGGNEKFSEVSFREDNDVVKGLDVNNAKGFGDTGLANLITRLKELGIDKENIILNITGGYKGLIPFLTILGQIYDKVRTVYLYEKSEKIIFIPKLPIGFNAEYAENYAIYLDSDYLRNPLNSDINKELEDKSLVVRVNNRLCLSAGGKIFKDYVDLNRSFLVKTTMGSCFELLVLEYYQKKYGNDFKIVRGVKKINGNRINSDIDLLLEKNNEFTCVSVKAFNKIRRDNFKDTERQFSSHVSFFKQNGINLLSFHHVIYLYENTNMKDIEEPLLQLQKILTQKSFPKCLFEVFYIKIPTNKKDPYNQLFKDGLKTADVKSFKLNNHV